jgi:two-component system chemotaxis response regulator CheV
MPQACTQAIIGLVEREGHFIQLLDLETIIADLSPDDIDFTAPAEFMAPRELKALVADDSATIRLMLKKTLERSGITPTVVGNGQEAQTSLRELAARAQAENRPVSDFLDILISDIEMPLMDGFSLTKFLKRDPILRDVPVILYSSIITDELRHKGDSVGADMQVAKPDLERLPEMAMQLVAAREAKRGLNNV